MDVLGWAVLVGEFEMHFEKRLHVWGTWIVARYDEVTHWENVPAESETPLPDVTDSAVAGRLGGRGCGGNGREA
jgi:hypothetical protein